MNFGIGSDFFKSAGSSFSEGPGPGPGPGPSPLYKVSPVYKPDRPFSIIIVWK